MDGHMTFPLFIRKHALCLFIDNIRSVFHRLNSALNHGFDCGMFMFARLVYRGKSLSDGCWHFLFTRDNTDAMYCLLREHACVWCDFESHTVHTVKDSSA